MSQKVGKWLYKQMFYTYNMAVSWGYHSLIRSPLILTSNGTSQMLSGNPGEIHPKNIVESSPLEKNIVPTKKRQGGEEDQSNSQEVVKTRHGHPWRFFWVQVCMLFEGCVI